ncbi:MAG: MOSC domain-containing protein [Bacteroidetes bacterium]|nr:MOSC domain-containing protein [Bacteroidota bacterium]
MSAHIVQISISNGGVPKRGIFSAEVTETGIVGDAQRDLEVHGGPMRALCIYSLEQLLALQREGHPIYPGSIGENVLTVGLDLGGAVEGDRIVLGDVEAEVTGYAAPCSNIADSFHEAAFTRISNKVNPGWSRLYLRILRAGIINVGDRVTLLPRPA